MLVMVGASASGKTEIAKILIKSYRFQKMVTYTTRPIRPGESDGVDYHFLTLDDFLLKQSRGEFIETVQYNGNLYGTAFSDTEDDKVLIVDPKGANVLHAKLGSDVVLFYLEADEHTRARRMKTRGDHLRDIQRRIEKDRDRFTKANLDHIDYVLDTNKASLKSLARTVYTLYTKHIKKTI